MITLINLPEVVLEKVFSFLTYDNIAQNRIVCTKFNEIGSKMLNKGYHAADKYHSKTLKAIKAKLPRRESERRVHPLARQCDILIAIETRLSMLAMTFTKWMDANLCCFIPGKVIDEIMRVLRCVANNPNPPRAHEILQELRDISSMAMEHFDEKILPQLKLNMGIVSPFMHAINHVDHHDELALVPKPRVCNSVIPQNSSVILAEVNKMFLRDAINRKKIKAQSILIAKQASEISELKKHVEEWEAKLRDLTANLTKAHCLPATSPPTDIATSVSTQKIKRKIEQSAESVIKQTRSTRHSNRATINNKAESVKSKKLKRNIDDHSGNPIKRSIPSSRSSTRTTAKLSL